jgi:ATP-dependent exoDNAse (exonuclease V) alpha subunit
MIEYEQDTIVVMRTGQNQRQALVSSVTRCAIVEKHAHLSMSQRAAVEQILSNQDLIVGLEGAAGAGKTTSLAAAREAAECEGYLVRGLAPTSRAAQKLAEAGIDSGTLQRHLCREKLADDGQKRLYVVDESSLASTKQINEFLHRLRVEDRVLLVGDTRQHEAVDAGKPYQQLQEAGMQTIWLEEILRQKDPALREAVEQLARGDVREAIENLDHQGRVHEVIQHEERLGKIAHEYVREPKGTLVISPDNESRRQLNALIHREMQERAEVGEKEHKVPVLEQRQEMTGADRQWAGQYEPGDVMRFSRGSKVLGIDPGEYARVESVEIRENRLTIEREHGKRQSYDPRRLSGVAVYKERERLFSEGDRVQFTAPSMELHIANRELGTIEKINEAGDMAIRLDSGRHVEFNVGDHPHIDYGYAVTSHSSQGQTAERVLINVDTQKGELLVNSRLAYVSVSRAQYEAQIYTNDRSELARHLSRNVSQRTATESQEQMPHAASVGHEVVKEEQTQAHALVNGRG